jgi:hypothetical protein
MAFGRNNKQGGGKSFPDKKYLTEGDYLLEVREVTFTQSDKGSFAIVEFAVQGSEGTIAQPTGTVCTWIKNLRFPQDAQDLLMALSGKSPSNRAERNYSIKLSEFGSPIGKTVAATAADETNPTSGKSFTSVTFEPAG